MPDLKTNVLYYGDNLDILRGYIPDGSVDLIYLDPPFNSNRSYNILFRESSGTASEAQIEAFEDTWDWGPAAMHTYEEIVSGPHLKVARMLRAMVEGLGHNPVTAYLCMMAVRLVELHRVLKPTGSIYLHCDPTAGPYLRVLMDAVFGPTNFRNEIVWKRSYSHGSAKRYGPLHDTILFFSKTDSHRWTDQRAEQDPEYIAKHFKLFDPGTQRRFQPITLTGSGVRHGESGRPWRDIDPTTVGRHWALPRAIIGKLGIEGTTVQEKLDALDGLDMIYWPQKEKGTPRLKHYADQLGGVALQDVWTDIQPISAQARERLGYPTQKPLALLERIISASSNEGDVVLDPFCGCGTAVHAAHKLDRRWIGIDVTHLAIGLIRRRMSDAFPGVAIEVIGEPVDIAGAQELVTTKPKQFEYWAVDRLNAHPTGGRGPDLDGVKPFVEFGEKVKRAVISVKGTKTVNPEMIREVLGAMSEDKPIGVLLLLTPPTPGMLTSAAAAGFYESSGQKYPKVQIITVLELLAGKQIVIPGPVAPFARAPREREQARQGRLG